MYTENYNFQTRVNWRFLVTIFIFCLLSGCTHKRETIISQNALQSEHIQAALNYQYQLKLGHPDAASSVLELDNELIALVEERFAHFNSKKQMTLAVVDWLLAENQLAMQYDLSANLSPQQAYEQRRANCLSFSLLFFAIARQLGIDSEFNHVAIPNIWNIEEQGNLVLYRHINNVVSNVSDRLIVDLALDSYDYGYPQEIISLEDAIARLHSNRATVWLQDDQLEKALHSIKLAVSLSPYTEDLWINLGVIYKKLNMMKEAEDVFLLAFELNKSNELAASSLERLYLQIGNPDEAQKYKAAAKRARNSNPYYHYQLAKQNYQESHFKEAQANIRRAIGLHETDPQFYELSSIIYQQLNRFDLALIDVITAYELARNAEDESKYERKAKLISQQIDGNEIRLNDSDKHNVDLNRLFNL